MSTQINTIKEKIIMYLTQLKKSKYSDSDKNPFVLSFAPLDGLSNKNYQVNILDSHTKKVLYRLFYRELGDISDIINRKTENNLLEFIANRGLGPKILFFDKEKQEYRIDEFLSDCVPIEKEKEFSKTYMEQIYNIFNVVSSFTPFYKFNVLKNADLKSSTIDLQVWTAAGCNNPITIECSNMFNVCMRSMYQSAKTKFDKFSEEFKRNYTKEKNKEIYENFEKLDNFMKTYHQRFLSTFPAKGAMVFCHNDTHRLNFLHKVKDEKLYVIDVEYAALNLIGNDIANYLNEALFVYNPEYKFNIKDLDFNLFYKEYLKYIDSFFDKFLNCFESEEERKALYDTIKTKKYYITLHNVINCFWFLYCLIYLNYSDYSVGNTFYFQHGLDRIQYYEKGLKELNKL